jgi:metallo-beta-lactamase class B
MKHFKRFAGLLILGIGQGLSAQPLQIQHLTGDFYIYTTYQDINGKPFPANGMYVLTNQGAIVLDTPWDTLQVVPLLDSIRTRHKQQVVLSVSTHFHGDRTAGLDILKRNGVQTYSSKQTFEQCAIHGDKQAQYYFENDTVFTVGQYTFNTFYPGKGHTEDNIVVWFDQPKILYGGCFIKSTEAADLGYTADGDVSAWEGSIRKTRQKFRKPRFIIPGHQSWKSRKSLKYTLKLIRQSRHAKKSG